MGGMTPDHLFLHGFLWGLGMGATLGALIVAIWYADAKPAGRRVKWLC